MLRIRRPFRAVASISLAQYSSRGSNPLTPAADPRDPKAFRRLKSQSHGSTRCNHLRRVGDLTRVSSPTITANQPNPELGTGGEVSLRLKLHRHSEAFDTIVDPVWRQIVLLRYHLASPLHIVVHAFRHDVDIRLFAFEVGVGGVRVPG